MESFIIEKAAELGIADKVLFTGFLKEEDINRVYQLADIYVLPSVSEPFGITVLEAMKNGAFDYLTKPVSSELLIKTAKHAIDYREIIRENKRLKNEILSPDNKNKEAFSRIITKNELMLSIFHYIRAVASTSFPVLITGETGVGKELIAEAIHMASGRKGPFIPVNIAGLSEQLIEDTLFGHKKGSYTGAESDRDGLVAK